jgi:23S rRNA pseudouridine2604 synthase
MDSISVNKFISSTGFCSRRAADKLLDEGRVKINGILAKKGNRVTEGDEVLVDNKPLKQKEKPVYIILNKPVGITCTTDLKDKDNIIDFVNFPGRIFPVGRLDKPSQGLIILTNDGDIVNKILRAGNAHQKEYVVTVTKPITKSFLKGMSAGVPILGTTTKRCKVKQINKNNFSIILTEGMNRQIRRMCEYFDYKVSRLKRTRIMHLQLDDLPNGKWRHLTDAELSKLKKAVQFSSKTAD